MVGNHFQLMARDTHRNTFWQISLNVLQKRICRRSRQVFELHYPEVRPILVLDSVLLLNKDGGQ